MPGNRPRLGFKAPFQRVPSQPLVRRESNDHEGRKDQVRPKSRKYSRVSRDGKQAIKTGAIRPLRNSYMQAPISSGVQFQRRGIEKFVRCLLARCAYLRVMEHWVR